jgi:hypothetical protein
MNKVDFYTENGNPAVTVRNQMKTQTVDYLKKVLTEAFGTAEVNSNKEISVPIAEDANTGTPIYARVSFSVTDRDPETVPKSKGSKDDEVTAVPSLFE